jgi:hypothetical protein
MNIPLKFGNRSNVTGMTVPLAHTPYYHIVTCLNQASRHAQDFFVLYQCYLPIAAENIYLYYTIKCHAISHNLV